MMNRKGDFLNNVVGIIIAVIGLSLLIFAITRLYSAHVNQEDENAKSTIDLVMSRINSLEDGQSANITLQGFSGSEHWYFRGWNKTSYTGEERPEKCFFDSCLCLCKGPSLDSCQGVHGFCRPIPNKDIVVRDFYYNYKYDNPLLDARSYIFLDKGLFEIHISKGKNEVDFSHIKIYS